ncbi:phosphotransferase family protein [Kitasatospora sp. NPDC059795]|uniref:phosphotransferase family protein n=1 Tax=Kitasatospora sp. NPDC059795 TaxID=3346949 RepID=UPI0036633F69
MSATTQVRAALAETALLQGFNPTGAQLLQEAQNWVFRLPEAGVVAKVHGRSTTHGAAKLQIRAAKALTAAGIPTAAPVGRIAYPMRARGHLVTFTKDLGDQRPTPGQLGELAARLHRTLPLTRIGLPLADRITARARRIDGLLSEAISDRDRAHLHQLLADAAHAHERIAWSTYTVHGDLNLGNAALTPEGAVLLDLETVHLGDPAWDRACMAWARDVFGYDAAHHEDFAAAYGHDVTTADGGLKYQVLTPLFGIGAYLYYAEWAARSSRPEVQAEADRRLETLLSRRPLPWNWSPVNV